ncbi:hypothetical protein ACFPM0_17740 [Pseudonocardia sulfidoxydans]
MLNERAPHSSEEAARMTSSSAAASRIAHAAPTAPRTEHRRTHAAHEED